MLPELLSHCKTFHHRNLSKEENDDWLPSEFIDPRLYENYEDIGTFWKTRAMHYYIHFVLEVINEPLSAEGITQMEEIVEGIISLIQERPDPDPQHLAKLYRGNNPQELCRRYHEAVRRGRHGR